MFEVGTVDANDAKNVSVC